MNELLRRHGFAILVGLGALIAAGGVLQGNVGIVVVGAILAAIGAIAVMPSALKLPLGGGIEWPDVYRQSMEKLEPKVERQGSVTADAVIVRPETARGKITTYAPVVKIEPVPRERVDQLRTVEDFADAVADSILITGTGEWTQPPASTERTGTIEPDDEP